MNPREAPAIPRPRFRATAPSIDSAAKDRMVKVRVAGGSRWKSGTVAPL